ncbi:MAG: radical SAM family heme chaperone HemW [Acidimicrobiales bacterium]
MSTPGPAGPIHRVDLPGGSSGPGLDVNDSRAFGVYVHVPFCRLRCDYCAFATYTDRDRLMGAYVDACVIELGRARSDEGIPAATSVYFGGGTPSRLPADALVEILSAVPRVVGAEVTVECNPEDVSASRLATYRAGGVTRISLGVQSTSPKVLRGLGRHGSERAGQAAAAVHDAGFESWSVDLMFGGPGENDRDWEQSLAESIDPPCSPPHLSAYALTVEPGTTLAAHPGRRPDDDVQATRYERADHLLAAAGYQWEEISNWARPGHRCRHNLLYWHQEDYRGIGSAAHSHRAGRRWWNVRTPDRYIAAVTSGRLPTAGEEVLGPEQRRFEALALQLRTRSGVDADALPDHPDLAGLVYREGGRAVLTVRGRLLANQVTTRLSTGPGHAVSTGTLPPCA